MQSARFFAVSSNRFTKYYARSLSTKRLNNHIEGRINNLSRDLRKRQVDQVSKADIDTAKAKSREWINKKSSAVRLNLTKQQKERCSLLKSSPVHYVEKIIKDASKENCLSAPLFDIGMRKLYDVGEYQKVLTLWRQMQKESASLSSLLPDDRMLRFIYSLLRKLGFHEEVVQLFEMHKNTNTHPEQFTGVLEAYAHAKRLTEIVDIYEKLNFPFHGPFYSELMRVYTITGDLQLGLELYERLRKEDSAIFSPHLGFSTNLLRLVKKHGTVDMAREIYLFISTRPDFDNYRCLNTYLSIISADGNIEEVEEIAQQIGDRADSFTRTALVETYISSGNPNKAIEIIEKYKNPYDFMVLCRHFVSIGDFESLDSHLRRFYCMREEFVVWNDLLNSLYKAGNLSLMDDYYKKYCLQMLPFHSAYNDESKSEFKSDWDIHQYSIGASIACIRYGLNSLQSGEKVLVVTGRGRHVNASGNRSAVKEKLLHSDGLGNCRVWSGEGRLRGCVWIQKQ